MLPLGSSRQGPAASQTVSAHPFGTQTENVRSCRSVNRRPGADRARRTTTQDNVNDPQAVENVDRPITREIRQLLLDGGRHAASKNEVHTAQRIEDVRDRILIHVALAATTEERPALHDVGDRVGITVGDR